MGGPWNVGGSWRYGRAVVAMVVTCALVVGCGGEDRSAGAGESGGSTSSTRDTATTASATTLAPRSVGLAPQFAKYVGGGAGEDCTDLGFEYFPPPAGPYVGPVDVERGFEQGGVATLCVRGFTDDVPIAVEVAWPTGERSSFEVVLDGTYQGVTADPLDGNTVHGVWTAEEYDAWRVRWVMPSTSPVGTYHMTAIQDSVVSDATMSVVEPRRGYLAMVDPPEYEGLVSTDRPQWAALGFQPDGVLDVGLYTMGDGGRMWELVEPLPQVRLDEGGGGIVEVSLAGYEPGRSYCVVHARDETPGESCLSGFTFEA